LPALFIISFFSTKFFAEKDKTMKVLVPTPIPSISSLPPSPEIQILLPWRISSAVIPVPPSTVPADLTKNWDLYTNPTFRFTFKYPKEWFLTEFSDTDTFIVKLSYPVKSSQTDSFVNGEKARILVSREEKGNATLDDFLSRKYNFSSIKKEEINTAGKKGWRIYNPEGGGEIIAFFEHGEKIFSIKADVKEAKDLAVYQELFILIQNTFIFS